MNARLGSYCINVTDLQQSIDFYENVIGLRVLPEAGRHEELGVTLAAEGGDGRIQLVCTGDLAGPIEHGNALRKIYFFVADCAETHQRALEAGWSSVREPHRLDDYPVTYALLHDPDGYVIELVQRHDR